MSDQVMGINYPGKLNCLSFSLYLVKNSHFFLVNYTIFCSWSVAYTVEHEHAIFDNVCRPTKYFPEASV